ncbi:unnamed protein product, partial [marine sediment metagenome]
APVTGKVENAIRSPEDPRVPQVMKEGDHAVVEEGMFDVRERHGKVV